jgi:hypothetical protein
MRVVPSIALSGAPEVEANDSTKMAPSLETMF